MKTPALLLLTASLVLAQPNPSAVVRSAGRVAVLSEAPGPNPYIFYDSRQLNRDYRRWHPIMPIEPGIIPEEGWVTVHPGVRRRVAQNDRVSFMVLDVEQKELPLDTPEPVPTHYHPVDQIGYIEEGMAKVQVGQVVRVVGPGTFYVAPSNIHHGVLPLSAHVRFIEVFTPNRLDLNPGFQDPPTPLPSNPKTLVAMVYEWYGNLEGSGPFPWLQVFLPPAGPDVRIGANHYENLESLQAWYETVKGHPIELHSVKPRRDGSNIVDVRGRKNGKPFTARFHFGPGPTIVKLEES